MSPAIGAVAWWSSNHVAWVRSISGSNVTIEEYNIGNSHKYNSPNRVIAAGSVSGYIHFKDLAAAAPPPPPDHPPFGTLDDVWRSANGAYVGGWTADPDAPTSPIWVHVYADNQFATAVQAGDYRPDVGNAFPGYGNYHGYSVEIGLGPGWHSVCSYAINVGSGGNNLQLGCKTIVIFGGHDPFGSLDVIWVSPSSITVAGWVIDPDTADPINVHVYSDNTIQTATYANGYRPDVAGVYPGYHAAHGYTVQFGSAPGWHNVCTYAINVGAGNSNTQLGCRGVTVPYPPGFGHPYGRNGDFQSAYDGLGGAFVLGNGQNAVYNWGSGCAQDFSGGNQVRSALMQRSCLGGVFAVAYGFWAFYYGSWGSGAVGVVGYPYNNAHRYGTGNTQDFNGGGAGDNMLMIGDHVGHVTWLHGAIRSYYINTGGAHGYLGYPTTSEYAYNGGVRQDFEGGSLACNSHGVYVP